MKHLRREQLIEATMKTIARYGYARTTMAHVAKTAGLSQGIVNFYFKTKEALLYETFVHLAEEYETLIGEALATAGDDPVDGLIAMIETDLGPRVCTPTKIAVWLAFWAESRSRPKYRDLYRKLADDYSRQVHELCEKLVARGGYEGLDLEAISVGFVALIDGFWVNLGVTPHFVEREKAKASCRAYFAGYFPADFGPLVAPATPEKSRKTG
ncbi:MAG: TetR family transcriptional regulator C-terminal domain-containing protein [Alphaproteobacteria bacterium]|nr:TetR family transcriptional regulator C-terminal domain-containing protein [Alphaproteobacteria bacterium]